MRAEVEALFDLEGDEFRNAVLRNAGHLSGELADASDDQLDRLREVVRSAWPTDGIHQHIHREENQIRFTDLGAHAWLRLAPTLDIAPDPDQWAALATSGVVMTDTSEWLRLHYTPEAALAAATLDDPEADRWGQLFGAIPSDQPLPNELVDAAVAHIREVRDPRFGLWHVGERLAEAGRLDALQAISARSDELGTTLRTWRARLGEPDATRTLLAEMTHEIEEGQRREWDDPDWLQGVVDPSLLPDLFGALKADLSAQTDDPFGPSRALQRAILRIGGEEAVRRYEELIEGSEESRFKFLRLSRDEIVQSELRRTGQLRAPEVAAALGVPVLEGRLLQT